MSAKQRADLITKLHKFAKKETDAVSPPSNRSVIEHVLYGCCLENSTTDAADEAFARLQENFFDWNEVRVTTAEELSELMKGLSDPKAAAVSLKKALHGIFECYYQFDLEFLKKENLGKSVAQFEKFKGVSPFVISYVAQNGLGGHSIPLDRSMLLLFYVLGIISEDEAAKGRVPGLERTIAKAKGVEFFIHVHPFAVKFASSPFNTKTREQILKLNKDAKERFPKRGGGRKKVAETKEKTAKATKKAAPKKVAPPKTTTASKKVPKKAAKKTKVTTTRATKKKTASKTASKPVKKKKAAPKKTKKTASKASATKRLKRKKPR